MRSHLLIAVAALAAWIAPARAELNVFATVPEWGALALELGGDKVKIYTATNALQDPHHVEAKPSLIARARTADLVVSTGAASKYPGLPGCTFGFPACCSTSGSQPTSSSAPVDTTRSAVRARAMRLGFAST